LFGDGVSEDGDGDAGEDAVEHDDAFPTEPVVLLDELTCLNKMREASAQQVGDDNLFGEEFEPAMGELNSAEEVDAFFEAEVPECDALPVVAVDFKIVAEPTVAACLRCSPKRSRRWFRRAAREVSARALRRPRPRRARAAPPTPTPSSTRSTRRRRSRRRSPQLSRARRGERAAGACERRDCATCDRATRSPARPCTRTRTCIIWVVFHSLRMRRL
jgi:hypothetical protein